MKKGILIFGAAIITLSLMAFSIINGNNSEQELEVNDVAINSSILEKIENKIFTDFIYDVGPRFQPITKTDLFKATSISDFISPESYNSIDILKSVNVIIIENERQTERQEMGYTKDLTFNQLKLLKASDYSTQFNIRSEFTVKNTDTGQVEHVFDSPHLSVVPEHQAVYVKGKDALIHFLREKGKEAIIKANVVAEKLQPAKLLFTITKNGTIENVKLDRSSNYPEIDKFMIELIQNTPDTWIPAENTKGEKVNQELVVSFGLMGC